MTARILGALTLALVSCGGAPAQTHAAPVSPVAPVAPVSPVSQVSPVAPVSAVSPPAVTGLHAVSEVLEGAGHACRLAGETLVCDEKKANVVTFGVLWANEPRLGPYLGFVASFNWKDANGCASATKKLNELTSKFDLLRSSCTDEHLVFALTVPVGERGVTAGDVRGLVAYFQGVAGDVLRSSGLVPLLE